MFIEENMRVCAVVNNGSTYSGTVYKIVIQSCEDDDYRPHALVFISQDKDRIEQEGEFGCVALWTHNIKQITVLNEQNYEKCGYYGQNVRKEN